MQYEELQSKVIYFLRFPLIIGIVFVHNYSSTVFIQGTEIGVANSVDIPIYHIISELFSQILGRISVPLFFFISGFLFFFQTDFNRNSYNKKLKRKIKSLLIPYLFWNIAWLLLYHIVPNIPILSAWLNGGGRNYNLGYIISSLWGIKNEAGGMTYPICYQFWFIRDLMVIVLLTPVLYLYIKKFKIYGVLLLSILWYLNCWFSFMGTHGLSIIALFFFTVGAWFSINKKNLVEELDKIKNISFYLYPLIVIIDLLTKGSNYNYLISRLGILFGIAFFFNLVSYLLNNGKIKVNAFLSASSFFIFAIHMPWLLSPIKKIFFKLFEPTSDLPLTLFYFMVPLLVVFISLILYYLLKRFCPAFTKIIIGGR
jgi:surface polysaccharide O-acyltransferase-like enzyme